MTAVLEPQAPGESLPVPGHDEVPRHASAPMVLEDPAAPFHCGAAMTAAPVAIAELGWAPLELGAAEWTCPCGHRVDGGTDGEPLEAVRLASARLESLQWELDAAQERFENAVRSASRAGVGQEALGRAAGLSALELREFLAGGPLA
ncbi:hypothetical protein [Pseudarthrobacter sp. NPDC080039]|uniref:hypothetical protein n=1 Tax=unclassified Pseudarthrobacter TaxID=2647000 RepID=UPI00344B4C84